MGQPALDQFSWVIGDDDNADPDGCTFDSEKATRTGQDKEENFMIRFRVDEYNGYAASNVNYQLYGYISDSSGDATQIDTGTTTTWAQLSDGTPTQGAACDSNITELSDPASGSFESVGDYCDTQDETDKITINANNFADIQFCLQFTASASDETTYYFWIRQDDAVMDAHTGGSAKVTTAGAGTLTINVNDGLSAAESQDLDLPITVSVSDSLSAGEATGRHERSFISKSDSIDLGELINLLVTEYKIGVSDALSVQESTNINAGELPTLTPSVSDSLSISESIERHLRSHLTAAESLAVTESVQRHLRSHLSVYDSVTVSEFQGIRLPILSFTVAEQLGASESVGRHERNFIAEVDAADVSEFVDLLIKKMYIEVSDSVSLSESTNLIAEGEEPTPTISVSELTSITESIELLLTKYTAGIVDQATLTESIGLALKGWVSESDSLTITDFVNAVVKRYLVSNAETLTITDYVNVTFPSSSTRITMDFSASQAKITTSSLDAAATFGDSLRCKIRFYISGDS